MCTHKGGGGGGGGGWRVDQGIKKKQRTTATQAIRRGVTFAPACV